MARPKGANPERTRSRILDAAIELFAERGLSGASIRDIASRAGVSLGMVRHYFGAKEQLYQACIEAMYDETSTLRDRLIGELDGADAKSVVSRAVLEGFRFAREHHVAVRLLQREIMEQRGVPVALRTSRVEPFLDMAVTALGHVTGASEAVARLRIQTCVFIVARYAVASEEELMSTTGAPRDQVLSIVERHLVDTVVRCFFDEA